MHDPCRSPTPARSQISSHQRCPRRRIAVIRLVNAVAVSENRKGERTNPERTMRAVKILIAVAAVALAAAGEARSEPLKIRNSYVVPVSNWRPLIVAKKDLAKHWGGSYVMEPVGYQGTSPMITALANGELEIANLAYSTLGLAIQNAGIDDLRVIADEFRDGVPGYFSNQYFVRKDSGIKKIEDLKGKVLVTNAV